MPDENPVIMVRMALNLTQRALARELGVHYNTVWRWEQDPGSIPTMALRMLAMMLDTRDQSA